MAHGWRGTSNASHLPPDTCAGLEKALHKLLHYLVTAEKFGLKETVKKFEVSRVSRRAPQLGLAFG